MTLTFTTIHRAGNFVRIFSALKRLGLKPSSGTINNTADPSMDSIQIDLNMEQQIEPTAIKKLREMVPTIVDIQIDAPSALPATRDSAEHIPSAQAAPETRKLEQTNALPHFDDERLNFETKRLAEAYPNDIYSAVKYLESAINPAQRQFVLTQLGIRIGMYAARKRKAAEKDSGINKTVRSSLAMQKSQFGRVSPVIAAMMQKKVARRSTSTESKSKTIASELDKFIPVSLFGNEVRVLKCPHCDSTHSSESPDCYFVAAFIESFIKDMWSLNKQKVTQTKSKATGAPDCVFVVSGVRL